MRLYTEVSYAIYDNDQLYKAETIGISHAKAIANSTIKIFLKRQLEKHKKHFRIEIVSSQMISEEEAFRRYGNFLVNTDPVKRAGKQS